MLKGKMFSTFYILFIHFLVNFFLQILEYLSYNMSVQKKEISYDYLRHGEANCGL